MTRGGLGGDRVEGRRAVRELLTANRRPVRRVWLARTSDPRPLEELAELARTNGADVEWTTPDDLRALARTEVPQGVVADAEPLRAEELDDLLGEPSTFLVALDGVGDPRNLGAILRSAEGAGATGVVLPRHRAAAVTPAAAKASAGAIEHLRFVLVSGVAGALDRASRSSVWTIGLDGTGESDLFDLPVADQPLMLVFGAEGRGLSPLARERCDVVARIPMRGRIESLNVSAAATIACFEIARRRVA